MLSKKKVRYEPLFFIVGITLKYKNKKGTLRLPRSHKERLSIPFFREEKPNVKKKAREISSKGRAEETFFLVLIR